MTAVVTQDDKAVRRLTLQSFQARKGGWYQGYEEHAFTFRDDEFRRLLTFLDRIAFLDLSNEDRFDIEDISPGTGRKAIIDAADRGVVEHIWTDGRRRPVEMGPVRSVNPSRCVHKRERRLVSGSRTAAWLGSSPEWAKILGTIEAQVEWTRGGPRPIP